MLIEYIRLNLIVLSQFYCIYCIIECLIVLLNFNCYCWICCINVNWIYRIKFNYFIKILLCIYCIIDCLIVLLNFNCYCWICRINVNWICKIKFNCFFFLYFIVKFDFFYVDVSLYMNFFLYFMIRNIILSHWKWDEIE
jgi:hypothetical protein